MIKQARSYDACEEVDAPSKEPLTLQEQVSCLRQNVRGLRNAIQRQRKNKRLLKRLMEKQEKLTAQYNAERPDLPARW